MYLAVLASCTHINGFTIMVHTCVNEGYRGGEIIIIINGFPQFLGHNANLVCYFNSYLEAKSIILLFAYIIGISVSTSKFKFTIGMLPFGAAMGVMTMIIIIITVTFIVITVILVRSRKQLQMDLERLKAKTIEQPAIYEELEYVHMAMAPQLQKPASSPTNSIDTGQNTAYASFSCRILQ